MDLDHLTLPIDCVKLLGDIENFQGQWLKLDRLEPAKIQAMTRTTIITSSGASTRIEGALLSDTEVRELIERGCRVTSTSSRSEREVAGYVRALNYVYDHAHDLPITERTIRELHQLLTSELMDAELPAAQRGAYKNIRNDVIERNETTGDEKVLLETTPPGPQTEAAMRALIADHEALIASQKVPGVVIVGLFAMRFLAVHPFRDGNGRLSRLLTTLLLLQSGYAWVKYSSHEKVIEDNKEGYYVNLNVTQRTLHHARPDYAPWLRYFLTVVRRQALYLESVVNEAAIAMPMQVRQLILSEQERAVLEIIRVNGSAAISDLVGKVALKREGLRDLLARLVKKGAVRRDGKGPATRYVVV
jgi:Fic family protein